LKYFLFSQRNFNKKMKNKTKKEMFSKKLPYLMLFLCLAISIYLSFLTWQSSKKEIQSNFGTIVGDSLKNFDKKASYYESMLENVQGLFSASISVDRDEFSYYFRGIEISKNYPEVDIIAFAQKVTREEKEAFMKKVREDKSMYENGYPEFKIFPEGDRDKYYIVNYLEPYESNRGAMGYDIYSDQNRKEAIDRALDSGKPVASFDTPIVGQEGPESEGFIVFTPVYKKGIFGSTVAERKDGIIGFVDAVVKKHDMFDEILEERNKSNVGYQVFEGRDNSEKIVYDSEGSSDPENKINSEFQKEEKITFAGRQWIVKFYSKSNFNIRSIKEWIFLIVFFFGLILSMIIFFFMRSVSGAKEKALKLVDEKTAEIKSSEERFRSITEAAKDAIVMMDNQGRVVLWNKSASEMFGYGEDEAMGKDLHALIASEDEHKSKKENILHFGQTGEAGIIGKNIELLVKKKDGTAFMIELTVSKTQIKGEWYAVGMMRDITERKKTEEEIKARTDELERLNRLMVGRELKMIELKKKIKKTDDESE
jgi:PAS domain S-box-containing protein